MAQFETRVVQPGIEQEVASSLENAQAGGMHDIPSWRQLSRGMPVQFRDGAVGTIEHIWVDSYHGGSGEIVVRLAAPPHREIIVPLDLVSMIEDVGIFVDRDSTQVELLSAAPWAHASAMVDHADLVALEAPPSM